jgi:N-acetylglucosamine-6-phosphate deacetylase
MHYSMIVDGVHLQEQAVQLAWQADSEGCILVTDSTLGMGMPDGELLFGGVAISKQGTKAVVAGSDVLAGSVVTMDEAVRRLWKITGSRKKAIEAASKKPAEYLGISDRKGTLAIGADADLVLLDDELQIHACYVATSCVSPLVR